MSNVKVLINEPVELKCEFKLGDPKGSITWLKDGVVIRSQVKYSVSSAWERLASLRINRAKLEDAGVFTCRAENASGIASTNCRLAVNQKPRLTLDCEQTACERVKVIQAGQLLTAHAGGRLVLKAVAEAVPGVEHFLWNLNGRLLGSEARGKEESRIVLEEEEVRDRVAVEPLVCKCRLVINNLCLADAGAYAVEASNQEGQANACLRVSVFDRPQPPTVVQIGRERGIDWLDVVWQRPASDGNSKINQYCVEKRILGLTSSPAGQTSAARIGEWVPVGHTSAFEDKFRVKNLPVNTIYSFRVAAENDYGVGEFAEIESPYELKSLIGEHQIGLSTLSLQAIFGLHFWLASFFSFLQLYAAHVYFVPDQFSGPC
ncbi:unnamed protein product [Protopolystoma xenopodis]|uniref:Ig-like domain-containing protein n=1 Tax=Protopolystoma xenopodis TaxID=117903 RepID=A0A3S5AA52_9PLAT|nr:unnamed protein product [Protopolystoma xenopodis]